MTRARRDAGYTLMEVLVMLAVTALIATVVFDAVRSASAFGLRVERAARGASGDYVDMAAFRRAVRAIRPDYADGAGAFVGDAAGFIALTAEAPGLPPGDRRVMAARLERDSDGVLVLLLETGSAARKPQDTPEALRRRLEIRRWPDATGVFDYLPATPDLPDPAGFALGLVPAGPPPGWLQTYPGGHGFAVAFFAPPPGAVRLTVDGPAGREVHIFHPAATQPPPARAENLLGPAGAR